MTQATSLGTDENKHLRCYAQLGSVHTALAYTYTIRQLFQICYDFRFSLFLACFKVWATHSYACRVKLGINTSSHTLGRRNHVWKWVFFPVWSLSHAFGCLFTLTNLWRTYELHEIYIGYNLSPLRSPFGHFHSTWLNLLTFEEILFNQSLDMYPSREPNINFHLQRKWLNLDYIMMVL